MSLYPPTDRFDDIVAKWKGRVEIVVFPQGALAVKFLSIRLQF